MRIVLNRFTHQLNCDKQTVGFAFVYNEKDILVYKFFTLELPDFNNQRQVSNIPKGKYKAVKRYSPKFGHHFHLLDVPNRDLILIHFGNYASETLGCILVGNDLKDINNDGLVDVTSSKAVMQRLNDIMPNSFEIEIL